MKTFQDIINEIAPEVEEWRKEHAIKIQKELERIRTGRVEEDGEKKVIEIVVKKCDKLSEKLYIPEQCKDCEVSKDKDLRSRIIGLNLVTPYSYLLIEGCNLDRICDKKNLQLLYFGLGVDTLMVDTFWNDYWKILAGEVVIGDTEEFIKEAKRKIGFIETKNGRLEKSLVMVLPKIVDEVVDCIIKEKLTCSFEYPLINFKYKVGEREKNGTVHYRYTPIEEDFNATPKNFFRLRLSYYLPMCGVTYSTIVYFGEGETLGLGDRYFSTLREALDGIGLGKYKVDLYDELYLAMTLDNYISLLDKKGACEVVKTLKDVDIAFKNYVGKASKLLYKKHKK